MKEGGSHDTVSPSSTAGREPGPVEKALNNPSDGSVPFNRNGPSLD
jgi:hypothetical protein